MAIPAVIEKDKFETDVPAEFHSLYSEKEGKMMLTEVTGIRTEADVTRLSTALAKERKDHRAVKDTLAELADYGGIEEIKVKLDKFPELEIAATGKVDEKSLEPIIEARIKTKLSPLQRDLEKAKTELAEKTAKVLDYETKENRTMIQSQILKAVKGKVQDDAVEDILIYADIHFTKDETGAIVTKDNVGVTPGVDPTVWLSEMLTKRSHWALESIGHGVGGNKGIVGGSNPFSHDGWNMTEQGKIAAANPARAEQLAKSAGTTVGGPRPAKK